MTLDRSEITESRCVYFETKSVTPDRTFTNFDCLKQKQKLWVNFRVFFFFAAKLTHEIVCSNYFMCAVEGASQVVLLVKNSPTNAGDVKRHGFDPWLRNILWRMAGQITPVLLPGESRGHRSLMGYSPWGHKEPDATEVT